MKFGPLPNADHTIKVRCIGAVGNAKFVNIFYLQYSGPRPDGPGCASIATSIGTAYGNRYKSLYCATTQLQQVEVTDLHDRSGATNIVTSTQVGVRAGSALPASVAACASLKVAFRYRGGHGRQYYPFGAIADVTGNNAWAGGFISSVNGGLSGFWADMNGLLNGSTTHKWVMVSYFTHDVNHVPVLKAAPDIYPIVGMAFRTRIDSQRRRTGKELS